ESGEHRVVRGRDAVAGKEILGEGLAALELRGRRAGPEDAQAGGLETIDDAGHQRHFGADHGESHALVAGQRQQRLDVGGLDVDVAAARFCRGAGVAGSDQHFGHSRRLRQLPRQCVFAAAGTDDEDFHGQCLKCLTPVNTIAMSCSSAAAITSASRIEPPGWITARMPASPAASRPSRNGKNASEAITEPGTTSPASAALMPAMRAEYTRLICPAPTPTVALSFAYTMALDFTYLATRQANSRSRSSASVGARFVTCFSSPAVMPRVSADCSSRPEPMRLLS